MYEFEFLIILFAINVGLILINRQSTMANVLLLVTGMMTFAFGTFSLTVADLPFSPYFNIFVIVIGVITMTVSIRGRN